MSGIALDATDACGIDPTAAAGTEALDTAPPNLPTSASSENAAKWLPASLTLRGALYNEDTLRLQVETYVKLKGEYAHDRDPAKHVAPITMASSQMS